MTILLLTVPVLLLILLLWLRRGSALNRAAQELCEARAQPGKRLRLLSPDRQVENLLAQINGLLEDREQETRTLREQEESLRRQIANISHDLRTPLTSISGNAGILMTNYHTICEEKKLTLYTAIYDDSMWLINLVENLLSVTRLEDGSMQLNTNAELIDEVIDEALQHIDRKSVLHKITVNRPDEFLMAKMDARLIIQVIINVVDNAIKYTPEGSEIDITTAKSGGDIVVSIADNGKGIADDAKKRIFDMFYTANMEIADSHRSLGLGLALCKSIINAHGGEITVLDNKPKGAIFRFTLPAEEVTLHE